YTDSNYVKDGISGWIEGWKRNGWKTADRKPVKNVELWQALDEARRRHTVNWHWVKGHAGHPENERADELAREGMAPFKRKTPAPLSANKEDSATKASQPSRRPRRSAQSYRSVKAAPKYVLRWKRLHPAWLRRSARSPCRLPPPWKTAWSACPS